MPRRSAQSNQPLRCACCAHHDSARFKVATQRASGTGWTTSGIGLEHCLLPGRLTQAECANAGDGSHPRSSTSGPGRNYGAGSFLRYRYRAGVPDGTPRCRRSGQCLGWQIRGTGSPPPISGRLSKSRASSGGDDRGNCQRCHPTIQHCHRDSARIEETPGLRSHALIRNAAQGRIPDVPQDWQDHASLALEQWSYDVRFGGKSCCNLWRRC